jgi:hypothetical protein
MFRWQRLALVLALWALAYLPSFAQSPVPIAVSGGYTPNVAVPVAPVGPAGPPPTLDPYLYSPNGFPIPNAWEQGSGDKYAAIFQVKFDFMSLEIQPAQLPTTLTSGYSTDAVPGALGQPNTLVLQSGTRSLGHAFGSRVFLTYWLADPEVLCVDANYFVSEKLSPSWNYASDATGLPLIARPFLNTATNQQSAVVLSSPNAANGNASDQIISRIMGGEVNLKLNVNGGVYNTANLCGPSIYILGGARWMQFNERFRVLSTFSTSPAGITDNLEDDFDVRNMFLGGQVGTQFRFRWWRITADLIGKCAFGPVRETARLRGSTTRYDAAGNFSADPTQGLYIQGSNAGEYDRTVYAALPEAYAGFGFDINEHIRFNVGWTVVGMTNVLRPYSLVNTSVNDQPFGGPVAAPLSPAPPSLNNTSFWASWLSLGFELVF